MPLEAEGGTGSDDGNANDKEQLASVEGEEQEAMDADEPVNGDDDDDDEEKLVCAICDEEMPISKFPTYPDGTVKGKRCIEDVRAEQTLRNFYKTKWATRFDEKWKELNKDRARKKKEIVAFRHACPSQGGSGKKRIKMTVGQLVESNFVNDVSTHRHIKVPMTWEQYQEFAATVRGGGLSASQASGEWKKRLSQLPGIWHDYNGVSNGEPNQLRFKFCEQEVFLEDMAHGRSLTAEKSHVQKKLKADIIDEFLQGGVEITSEAVGNSTEAAAASSAAPPSTTTPIKRLRTDDRLDRVEAMSVSGGTSSADNASLPTCVEAAPAPGRKKGARFDKSLQVMKAKTVMLNKINLVSNACKLSRDTADQACKELFGSGEDGLTQAGKRSHFNSYFEVLEIRLFALALVSPISLGIDTAGKSRIAAAVKEQRQWNSRFSDFRNYCDAHVRGEPVNPTPAGAGADEASDARADAELAQGIMKHAKAFLSPQLCSWNDLLAFEARYESAEEAKDIKQLHDQVALHLSATQEILNLLKAAHDHLKQAHNAFMTLVKKSAELASARAARAAAKSAAKGGAAAAAKAAAKAKAKCAAAGGGHSSEVPVFNMSLDELESLKMRWYAEGEFLQGQASIDRDAPLVVSLADTGIAATLAADAVLSRQLKDFVAAFDKSNLKKTSGRAQERIDPASGTLGLAFSQLCPFLIGFDAEKYKKTWPASSCLTFCRSFRWAMSVAKEFIGTELDMQATSRIQLDGDRDVFAFRFADVAKYLQTRPGSIGKIQKQDVLDFVKNSTASDLSDLKTQLRDSVFHARVTGKAMVYIPGGFVIAEQCHLQSFGYRRSSIVVSTKAAADLSVCEPLEAGVAFGLELIKSHLAQQAPASEGGGGGAVKSELGAEGA